MNIFFKLSRRLWLSNPLKFLQQLFLQVACTCHTTLHYTHAYIKKKLKKKNSHWHSKTLNTTVKLLFSTYTYKFILIFKSIRKTTIKLLFSTWIDRIRMVVFYQMSISFITCPTEIPSQSNDTKLKTMLKTTGSEFRW